MFGNSNRTAYTMSISSIQIVVGVCPILLNLMPDHRINEIARSQVKNI